MSTQRPRLTPTLPNTPPQVAFGRVFNVTGNRLEGSWPDWLLSAVGCERAAGGGGVPAAVGPRCAAERRQPTRVPHPCPRTRAPPQVPQAALACSCPVAVRLNGDAMRLACPRGVTRINDYPWQARARARAWL